MYPIAAEAIRSVSPGAWIVCETYSHPEPYLGPKEAPGFGEGKPPWADECLDQFPKGDGIFAQWVCDQYVQPLDRRHGLVLVRFRVSNAKILCAATLVPIGPDTHAGNYRLTGLLTW